MEKSNVKTDRLEDQEFMHKTLIDIKEEADRVISDRKNNTLQLEWITGEYSIKIEIKKTLPCDSQIDLSQIPDEEKEIVNRLAEGQKQVQVAKEMGISQAKVSVIKNKNASLLTALMASAIPIVGSTVSMIEGIKKSKK